MDQTVGHNAQQRDRAVESLSQLVAAAVDNARVCTTPFFHLEFDRIFPDEVYSNMIGRLPVTSDYRPMSGRRKKDDRRADGTPTRVKIDLFLEYVRRLPLEKRAVWEVVGAALCSSTVREAFVRRLAPALERRFGARYPNVRLYPIPILTRDIAGYSIDVHSDAMTKGITAQFYLPRDESIAHVGTAFHGGVADGRPLVSKMKFAPNTGYAFAVDLDTHHSVDRIGPEVTTRDSILLTYYLDTGALNFIRNRVKRVGNFLGNEIRQTIG
jgi:hypothetical protein